MLSCPLPIIPIVMSLTLLFPTLSQNSWDPLVIKKLVITKGYGVGASTMEGKKKCTFYLSVNVFSTKVLIGDTILTSPTGDRTAILHGHPSHAKV